jgi:capsular polysaccharide biosynthesis protein
MNKVNKNKELVSYLIIIALIFVLCAVSYYTYKKEKYYQNNNSVYVEKEQNYGCNNNELKNRIVIFYKKLNNYQNVYKEKMSALHKYEDLSEELIDSQKELKKSEDVLRECLPNFSV